MSIKHTQSGALFFTLLLVHQLETGIGDEGGVTIDDLILS